MPNIISTQGEKGNKKKKARRLKVIILVVLLLCAAGVAGYFWWQQAHPVVDVDKNAGVPKAGPPMAIESSESILDAVGKTADLKEKTALYKKLVVSQQLNGDLDGALRSAKELLALEKSASNYAMLGGVYRAQKDTANAIASYKEAIAMTPVSSDSDEISDYNYYKKALSELEGAN